MTVDRPTLFRLETPIRRYAWGSHDWLSQIRGATSPSAEPEAELWIGAHHADSGVVPNMGPLNQLITEEPEYFLGSSVTEKYGRRLPFLLKVLAVGKPLSLQVHPTLEQARIGFLNETEAGISVSSSDRTFVDDSHKPELLVAVTDFDALVGFRELDEAISLVELFIAHGADRLTARILNPLVGAPNSHGLREAFEGLVGQPDDELLIEQTVRAARQVASSDGRFAESARWLIEIARLFPGRPDVVATLLLNLVHLTPGGALYVAPGQVHAYLGGLGIEIMSSSDNVVRGGLTPKHVDVPSFLAMIDWTPGTIYRIEGVGDDSTTTWTPPIDDFVLTRIEARGDSTSLTAKAPMVLFSIDQGATVERGDERIELKQGESIFVAPGSPISISGTATLWSGTCSIGQ
ncbi:mannose-6-phosphate isomerase [mine drainage metagenome]|uniref:mannose-6-phosphate isomerase n=1 Tax=mine drainage metagenome TaxID=410659 RepID=A0A1J5Q9D8_9ZZZZ